MMALLGPIEALVDYIKISGKVKRIFLIKKIGKTRKKNVFSKFFQIFELNSREFFCFLIKRLNNLIKNYQKTYF